MAMETILGLDVGTTTTKAVLFDLSGAELMAAEQAYRLRTPRPGWAELDPVEIWQAVVKALQTIVNRLEGHQILALALATQGGSLIPVRVDGMPTYPVITWMDGRSQDVVQQWQADGVADRVRQVSGWSPEPGLPLASIEWLRRFRPELFAATDRFLSVNDFLTYQLTGRFCTNPSMAGEMLLTDVATGQWSRELCALVGLEPDQLSPILPSDTVVGVITPKVSRLTGLDRSTLVINGGQDHSCEALALGMTTGGRALLACGTAWVINGVAESTAMGAIPSNMNLNFHILPQRWIVSQFLGALGGCLEWWLNQGWQHKDPHSPFCRAELFASFDTALEQTVPGCAGLLFLPLTGGRQLSRTAPGGGFVGLRLDHTRADMSRAIMEGAAFELHWALDRLAQAGMPVEQLWMVGGATSSPLWPNIVADVTGLPIYLTPYTHGPALGAGILAGVGANVFETMMAGQKQFSRPAHRIIMPNDSHRPAYDEQFAAYQRLTRVLFQ
jgi:xylulokinase